MYQVTRKSKISEQLQLCHADGSVALDINVEINVDTLGNKINKAYEIVGRAQNELKKDPHSEKLLDEYGAAVIALFEAIFGAKNAADILAFYDGNETEMLLDIFPFINEVILPMVRAASEARKEQLRAAANLAKRIK